MLQMLVRRMVFDLMCKKTQSNYKIQTKASGYGVFCFTFQDDKIKFWKN